MAKGGSKSASTTAPVNEDKRVAVQDGTGISGSNNTLTTNYDVISNDTDVVKAIAQLGTDAIQRTGEAVVQLNGRSQDAYTAAWDTTVRVGADLTDRLIDQIGRSQAGITDQFGLAANSWDRTVDSSTSLLSKVVDGVGKSLELSGRAIDSFQPTENKMQDTSLKLGMIVAAGVAATILLSRTGAK